MRFVVPVAILAASFCISCIFLLSAVIPDDTRISQKRSDEGSVYNSKRFPVKFTLY